jgi:hypothetical protein
MNADQSETRQERREERLKKKREKIPQHGKGLGRIYRNAVIKQAKEAENR